MRFFPNGKFLAIAAVAGFGLSLANQPAAQAATESANLDISATVAAACNIATLPMNFGTYDSLTANASGGSDLLSAFPGVVAVACANGLGMNITLDGGQNFGGGSRNMAGPNPGDLLSYGLHFAGTGVSGTPPANCADPQWPAAGVADTGTGSQVGYWVYGCAPKGQAPSAGAYGDTVVATVTF